MKYTTSILSALALLTASVSAQVASCPASDKSTITFNGREYTVECNTDRPGGDMPNGLVWVSSLDDCIAECSQRTGCRAATWNPGNPGPCYLKNEIKADRYSPDGQVTVTSPLFKCPRDDGKIITSGSRDFKVECFTDRPGGDLPNGLVWVSSLDDCVAACSANSLCRTATWNPGNPGPCYLKGEIKEGNYSPSGQVSVTSPLYTCPANDNNTPSLTADSKYTIECSQDRIGGDLPGSPVYVSDIEHCLDACESTQGCIAGALHLSNSRSNSACFLKGSVQGAFTDAGVVGFRRQSVCPDLDGQTYTSSCGATYEVECFKDRYGAVMAPSPVATSSFKACADLCSSTSGCVDISWSQGFPSGTCYLKSAVGVQEADSKIWGAKQLTGCAEEG